MKHLATRQDFIFIKTAHVQSINNIFFIRFFINAALLNVYFFVKKLMFSNDYVSANTYSNVFTCLLVEKGAINYIQTHLVGRWGISSKMCPVVGGVTPHLYVCTYAFNFNQVESCFGSMLVL